MFGPGNDNFIVSGPGSGQRPRYGKSNGSHVCAESDCLRIVGTHKIRYGLVRRREHRIAFLARRKATAVICITLAQVLRDGIDDSLRHLRSSRSIKKNGWISRKCPLQRRKLVPDGLELFGIHQC